MLKRHPQIYMSEIKETRFFAQELHPHSRSSARLPSTLEQYLSLFAAAKPGQRAGEASPSYLRSLHAAERIGALRPDARIVAILREPASFVRSLHLQLLQAHVETEKDLGKALALEEGRRREAEAQNEPIPQGLMYSEHVRYVQQLGRFQATFPPEQMLVLIYDDFRADNARTLRQVQRFLEVDESTPVELVEANPTVRVRSPRLYGAMRSLYMGRGPAARLLKPSIKAITPRRLRREAMAMQRRLQWSQPQARDRALMLELRRRYKDEVHALSEALGRDLVKLWGYDTLK